MRMTNMERDSWRNARLAVDRARRDEAKGATSDANETWAFAVAWMLRALAGGK